MPNLHDIERRINSVNSTKQITRTMQMVAAAKIRRASQRVVEATPYAESMAEMLGDVAQRVGGSENALLQTHDDIKNVLVIAVVSDRGLAGGFNSNILRHVEKTINAETAQGRNVRIIACGKKAISFFNFRKVGLDMVFKDMSADPTIEEAASIAAKAIDEYESGECDKVVLVYNHTLNAAEQKLTQEEILPIDSERFAHKQDLSKAESEGVTSAEEDDTSLEGDVIFEPSADSVLDTLLPAYVKTMIYHALIDSAAGEQGARRTAMQSATDNANEMVDTLNRYYNRVRQGAITTEINEIVGGAAALED
ncbi:MAG: ATP synthase F1 subunit gamma [Eggerthellaceae bacterium]|jgi:F-type H+-transporting ATPase subunit gamma|nr:ATP synthase F1 subunit gamma [Eggerthellaceae bacterium]